MVKVIEILGAFMIMEEKEETGAWRTFHVFCRNAALLFTLFTANMEYPIPKKSDGKKLLQSLFSFELIEKR